MITFLFTVTWGTKTGSVSFIFSFVGLEHTDDAARGVVMMGGEAQVLSGKLSIFMSLWSLFVTLMTWCKERVDTIVGRGGLNLWVCWGSLGIAPEWTDLKARLPWRCIFSSSISLFGMFGGGCAIFVVRKLWFSLCSLSFAWGMAWGPLGERLSGLWRYKQH